MHSRLFSSFSYSRFGVYYFMLRSLIHLDLSFVQGDKYGSICILLHADIQLDQHHLLKMLSFFHCMVLASLSKSQVSVGVWDSFWVFNLILFHPSVSIQIPCSFYHYCSIVQLKVRNGDISRDSFIIQDSSSYHGLFISHMKLRIVLLRSVSQFGFYCCEQTP